MHHVIQVRHARIRHAQDLLNAVQHALRRILGHREHFGGVDLLVFIIDENNIGEGTTHINANSHCGSYSDQSSNCPFFLQACNLLTGIVEKTLQDSYRVLAQTRRRHE